MGGLHPLLDIAPKNGVYTFLNTALNVNASDETFQESSGFVFTRMICTDCCFQSVITAIKSIIGVYS